METSTMIARHHHVNQLTMVNCIYLVWLCVSTPECYTNKDTNKKQNNIRFRVNVCIIEDLCTDLLLGGDFCHKHQVYSQISTTCERTTRLKFWHGWTQHQPYKRFRMLQIFSPLFLMLSVVACMLSFLLCSGAHAMMDYVRSLSHLLVIPSWSITF